MVIIKIILEIICNYFALIAILRQIIGVNEKQIYEIGENPKYYVKGGKRMKITHLFHGGQFPTKN